MLLLTGTTELCVIVLTGDRHTLKLRYCQFDNCRYYWYKCLALFESFPRTA